MFKKVIISFETLGAVINKDVFNSLTKPPDETLVFHPPLSNNCWKIEFVLAMTRSHRFCSEVSCDTSTLTRIELDRTSSRLLCTFRNVVPNVNFTSTVTRVGKRAALTNHLLSIVKLIDKMREAAFFPSFYILFLERAINT